MAGLLPLRISDELLVTTETPYWHIPSLAWNARVRSDDLLSRGALRQRGEHAQPVREIRRPFDVNHLA
jgi:hypothetical protein